MSQWRDPPPVVVLSGTHEYLRSRELREAITVAEANGRTVERVRGDDRDEISRILSSTGVFFQENVLVIVDEPEKVDPALVIQHHESEDNSVVLVLNQEGNFKARSGLGKVAKALPDRLVAKFEKPKPWEEVDHAARFCVDEARRRKLKLNEPLARAIVQNVGADLGMLAFEILKLDMLLADDSTREIAPAHVKAVIAAFGELGPAPVVDAMERRDLPAVARALANMRRTHAGNLSGATMRACAFLGRSAARWLHVAALQQRNLSVDQISEKVGVHAFVVRKTLAPAARRWGQGRLTSLVRSISRVERSVKSGHVSPWVQLECALLGACTEGRE